MNKQFSLRFAQIIDSMGINPTEFARRAKIPQGTVSKCLNGHVPTARILLRIAKLSGKSVDWLLVGAGGRAGAGYVAEQPARYGRSGRASGKKTGEDLWVEKLRSVLRGKNRQKTRAIKDVLQALSRK
jgi:transcriptional regulator with XRE-family HTH domain